MPELPGVGSGQEEFADFFTEFGASSRPFLGLLSGSQLCSRPPPPTHSQPPAEPDAASQPSLPRSSGLCCPLGLVAVANPCSFLDLQGLGTLCLVAQSRPTLCDPMEFSPPGSSVHGDSPGKSTGVGCHALLQGESSQPRDRTRVSRIAGGFFTV